MMLRFLSLLAVPAVLAHSHDHGDHSHAHGEDAGHSDVVVLDGDNFKAEVAKSEITMVEFYAPWCGHCKRLAPEYETAAQQLIGNGIALAKMDCTSETNKQTCSEFGVRGYPTIKIFHKDGSDPEPYEGARTSDGIIKFMRKQTEAAFQDVNSQSEIDELAKTDFTVVGFFPAESGAEWDTFTALAKKLRNEYSFGVSTDAALAQANGASVPGVVVFKDFDDKKVVMSTAFDAENLESFVNEEAFPLLGEIGPDNYSKYMDRKVPLGWFFLDFSGDALETQEGFITKVAEEFKGKFSMVKLDGVRWAEHAKTFGLKDTPGFCIQDIETKKMYKLSQDGDFNEATVRAHVKGVSEGTIAATVKSQDVPETNDGPVFVLVGKNFEEVVYDETKDVMVEFYAPWCGHCKSLSPKYDKLGEQMKQYPNVLIAKVDSTENDTPEDISGFPTLKFYPARAGTEAIDFNGDRTTQGLSAFILEKALTIPKGTAHTHDEL